MTHDELLAKINVKIKCDSSEVFKLYKALLAVVELHKPTPEPVFVSELGCKICDSSYPCPTIQAIEKELN